MEMQATTDRQVVFMTSETGDSVDEKEKNYAKATFAATDIDCVDPYPGDVMERSMRHGPAAIRKVALRAAR